MATQLPAAVETPIPCTAPCHVQLVNPTAASVIYLCAYSSGTPMRWAKAQRSGITTIDLLAGENVTGLCCGATVTPAITVT